MDADSPELVRVLTPKRLRSVDVDERDNDLNAPLNDDLIHRLPIPSEDRLREGDDVGVLGGDPNHVGRRAVQTKSLSHCGVQVRERIQGSTRNG